MPTSVSFFFHSKVRVYWLLALHSLRSFRPFDSVASLPRASYSHSWQLRSLKLCALHLHSRSLRSLGICTLYSLQRSRFARRFTIIIKKNLPLTGSEPERTSSSDLQSNTLTTRPPKKRMINIPMQASPFILVSRFKGRQWMPWAFRLMVVSLFILSFGWDVKPRPRVNRLAGVGLLN